MQKHSFASFDIDSFYPSITESLLSKAISFAKNYTTISDEDIDIIMHCRKSLLFDNETAWTKKNHSNMFDVTIGSFDGAEVCKLISVFLLNNLSEKYAPAYSNQSKRCHLCLTENLYLIRAKKASLLNKRSELISKCRHENKFYLANFTSRQQ